MIYKNQKYNGWTNYATWRVNLEIFDGQDLNNGINVTSESCKEYVIATIEDETSDCSSRLATDYALAFIEDVNWSEISDSINETI